MTRPELSLARDFEAALAWWRDAGVDCDFVDDATAWLADAAPQEGNAGGAGGPAADPARTAPPGAPGAANVAPAPAAAASPSVLRRDLLGDSPPQSLMEFRDWWLATPALETARAFPRIAPRGASEPALMVLVPQPEESDRDTLLSGPQGRLLANILVAMGLAEDAVYIASALPSHTPMADLAMIAASGMDAVTAHHIALVKPARLVAFGTGLAPMLFGAGEQPLREINHAGGKVPVMSSETLDSLMDMPRLKARFWRRWMEWSASH